MKNLFNHTNHLTIYAIIFLVIGLTFRYIVGRRSFNRRGIGGMQYFKTYHIAIAATIIEKVVNIIAALMIIGAIFLYLIK